MHTVYATQSDYLYIKNIELHQQTRKNKLEIVIKNTNSEIKFFQEFTDCSTEPIGLGALF